MALPRIEGGWWVAPGPLNETIHLAHVFVAGDVLMHCGLNYPVTSLRPRLPADTVMCVGCAAVATQTREDHPT